MWDSTLRPGDNLPNDVNIKIFYYLDGDIQTQLNFRSINKWCYNNLHIVDLYNIDYNYNIKLNDEILKKYKHVKYLSTEFGNITNEGLQNLIPILEQLDASDDSQLSDIIIKKLNICSNKKITDYGIRNLDLKILQIMV